MKCKAGYVRNPRTDRCVKADGLLGRTILAATRAIAAGEAPARQCPGAQEYDYATGQCVDGGRALALRELARRGRMERRVSNANAAVAAKDVTSRIFNAVRAKNYAAAANATDRDLRTAQGDAVELFRMVQDLQAGLGACGDALERSQQRERQLTAALLRNSDRSTTVPAATKRPASATKRPATPSVRPPWRF